VISTQHIYFGWEVTHFQLPDKEQFSIIIQRNIPLDKLSCKTFYTVGRIVATRKSEDFALSDRLPGFFSVTDLPPVLERGTHVLTADGDCEWWCLDGARAINGGVAPVFTPVALDAGQAVGLPVGTNLLVCEGEGVIDQRVFAKAAALSVRSEEKTLVARTKFYGLIFDRVNTK
tara:strand:+ start:1012 stop:1533 length:522 start_codon:yes stop_codon:yes gene_type:complete